MKVLLKEDIDNLGYAGEVMKVANGYGRNYLIPQGLAVKASPSVLKQAHAWRERAAVRMVEVRKEHEALAARISEVRLEFTARAGETGKLYGSVTTADVADQLNEVLGTEIDRRNLVGGPLRQLGENKVTLRLSRDYQPQVTVMIHRFEEEEEEVVEEVAGEAGEESEETSEGVEVEEVDTDIESDEPVAEADEPVAKADEPVTEADEPVAEANEPVAEADKPVADADEPVVEADEPVVELIEEELAAEEEAEA